MRVYILNTYEEHGPQDIVVALSKESILAALDGKIAVMSDRSRSFHAGDRIRMLELLEADDPSCSNELSDYWGGFQLHIVDMVD